MLLPELSHDRNPQEDVKITLRLSGPIPPVSVQHTIMKKRGEAQDQRSTSTATVTFSCGQHWVLNLPWDFAE